MNISNVLFVGIGGFIGSILRYVISSTVQNKISTSFPIGTFSVNIIGCFLIGFLVSGIHKFAPHQVMVWNLLIVGVLGGFTTFSAFGSETYLLLQTSNYLLASLNILASIAVGLFAVWLGHQI